MMLLSKHVLPAATLVLNCFLLNVADHHKEGKSADKVDRKIPREAVVVLEATKGNDVSGTILLQQKKGHIHVSGEVRGLTEGKHGFHIHQYGDLRDPEGKSAGGHFNPTGKPHGSPDDRKHHVGDLGNITANKDGVAKVDKWIKDTKVHFVVGRSIVVHAGEDDLESQPSGDAGPRVAVGVIGFAEVK